MSKCVTAKVNTISFLSFKLLHSRMIRSGMSYHLIFLFFQLACAITPSRGMWLWNSDIILNKTAVAEFFSIVSYPSRRVQVVYALIDRGMPLTKWNAFIESCSIRNIRVEALLGDNNWLTPSVPSATDAPTLAQQIRWIDLYQGKASSSQQFSGIHLDIEPWTMKDWSEKQRIHIDSYLAIIEEAKLTANKWNITLTADVPFWCNKIICENTTLDSCLLHTNRLSHLTYMTYRNTAKQILELAKPLLEKGVPDVWISVETAVDVMDETLISYGSKNIIDLDSDLSILETELEKYSNFAGIAMHDYRHYLILINQSKRRNACRKRK